MNLSQIRSQVRTYLMNTSTDTASLSWTDAELNRYINEAVFYVQQLGEWYVDCENTVVVAGTSTYTAPSNEHQFIRQSWDRSVLPQTNEYELDRDTYSTWRAQPQGSPAAFYRPNLNQVALYPAPNTTGDQITFASEVGVLVQITGDVLYTVSGEFGVVVELTDDLTSLTQFRSDYAILLDSVSPQWGTMIRFTSDEGNISSIFVAIPQQLQFDSDIPQLPVYAHFAFVAYATMKAFARDGEYQDLNLAKAWFATFTDWMEAAMSIIEWPTRVLSLEPWTTGSILKRRMESIGYPSCVSSLL